MKGVKHYTKDGMEWSHKNHTKTSEKLFHFDELSKKAKARAKG